MKSGAPNNPNACYRCGEVGHYAHQCPKKQNQQAPQNQADNQKFNARPPHTAKVNYVSSDAAQETPELRRHHMVKFTMTNDIIFSIINYVFSETI